MKYRLVKLAPGAYDVFMGEEVVASLVRNGEHSLTWVAELLADPPTGERPAPFTRPLHRFGSLEQACAWLDAEAHGEGVRVRRGGQG